MKYFLYESWEIYDIKLVFEIISWFLNEGYLKKYESLKYIIFDEVI